MCDGKNKPFPAFRWQIWVAFLLQVLLVAPSFYLKRSSTEEGWREVTESLGVRGWEHLSGGEGAGAAPFPDHVCFTCSSSVQNVKLGCLHGFRVHRKGMVCLLHHMEANGKVLLMLVPRGIWDRAGHFKGTASLFFFSPPHPLLWFPSPTQSPCLRTSRRGAGEGGVVMEEPSFP